MEDWKEVLEGIDDMNDPEEIQALIEAIDTFSKELVDVRNTLINKYYDLT